MYLYILNIKLNSRSNIQIQVIHIEGISFLPLLQSDALSGLEADSPTNMRLEHRDS